MRNRTIFWAFFVSVLLVFASGVLAKGKPRQDVLEKERPRVETWQLKSDHNYRPQTVSKNGFKNIWRGLAILGTLTAYGKAEFNGEVVSMREYVEPKTRRRGVAIVFNQNNEEAAIYLWRVKEFHWHAAVKDEKGAWQIGEAHQLGLKLGVDKGERTIFGVDVYFMDGTGRRIFIPFGFPIKVPDGEEYPNLNTGRLRLTTREFYELLTPWPSTCVSPGSMQTEHDARRCDLWR